jgi:hypothetical protein
MSNDLSDWTVRTLREYILALLFEKDKQNEQRFQAQESAVQSALIAAERAAVKSEAASEKRFENTNEWRQVVTDRDQLFARTAEMSARFQNLEDKITALAAETSKAIAAINRLVYTGLGIVLLATAVIGWIVKH